MTPTRPARRVLAIAGGVLALSAVAALSYATDTPNRFQTAQARAGDPPKPQGVDEIAVGHVVAGYLSQHGISTGDTTPETVECEPVALHPHSVAWTCKADYGQGPVTLEAWLYEDGSIEEIVFPPDF